MLMIILTIPALIVCTLLLLFLVPTTLSGSAEFSDTKKQACLIISWGAMVRLLVDYSGRKLKTVIKIFWYKRDLAENDKDETKEKDIARDDAIGMKGPATDEMKEHHPGPSPDIQPAPSAPPAPEEHKTTPDKEEKAVEDKKKQKASADEPEDVFFSKEMMFYFIKDPLLRSKLLGWTRKSLRLGLRMVLLEKLAIDLHAGFEDPDDTGRMYGYALGIQNALSIGLRKPLAITIRPSFEKPCMEIKGLLRMHTTTARIVLLVCGMLVIFPYLSTFLAWRRFKKEKSRSKDS